MVETGFEASTPAIIERIACQTALGNQAQSLKGLLNGEIALKKLPVLGKEGGDKVPLALRAEMEITKPPRWWDDVIAFYNPFKHPDWGSARFPVIVTSSNFGIDALYGLGRTKDDAFATWSTSDRCVDALIQHFGWGENVTLISHACVSAQLGLQQAHKLVDAGLAESVLLFSFDFVGPFVAAGFHSLKILNEQMPAPYMVRDFGSIGLGDGMAMAIIRKGEKGWRLGLQNTYNEMYHFTANQPDGSGFETVIAPFSHHLADRSFWIKGHGTGTLDAGRLEANTTQKYFPQAPLVSWKGSLGHTLGSCALVELSIAIAAMEQGTIPATVGCSPPTFTDNVATETFSVSPYEGCLLLSNAFGGAHAAMWIEYV